MQRGECGYAAELADGGGNVAKWPTRCSVLFSFYSVESGYCLQGKRTIGNRTKDKGLGKT